MKANIHYSRQALRDLDEIFNYIAGELKNTSAAQRMIGGILDAVDTLAQFPESGSKLIFDPNLNSGYRYVQHKKYLAFYHLLDGDVYVDRVLYGKQDYEHLL